MILSILRDEHLSQILVTWLSIDLILFLGKIIDFNLKDKSRTHVFMEIVPRILFLRSWMSKQISFSFIYFFVGILTSNDALIEVPKFN